MDSQNQLNARKAMQNILGPIKNHVYGIRNRKTGLWSDGGKVIITWSKKAKIWRQLNHVRSHAIYMRDDYKDAEIVELEPVEFATHKLYKDE